MKMNIFLKIGLIGAAITAVNHLIMHFILGTEIQQMVAYYVVWVVFIFIGIGFTIGNRSGKIKAKKEIKANQVSSEESPDTSK